MLNNVLYTVLQFDVPAPTASAIPHTEGQMSVFVIALIIVAVVVIAAAALLLFLTKWNQQKKHAPTNS